MQRSVIALVICLVLLSPQYLGSINFGYPTFSHANASSQFTPTFEESSGTALQPGTVSSLNTLSEMPRVVQYVAASPPFFVFNSSGLFWGDMEMKLPIETIAAVTNQCVIAQSSTLTNNGTTYDYSSSGAFSGDCGTFSGAIQSTLNVYVDNITGSVNKEVYISGAFSISGTGNVSNNLILPLALPSDYSVYSNSINSSGTSFNWADMSQFSPIWNSTVNALTVETPYVNGSSVIAFKYDPTLVQDNPCYTGSSPMTCAFSSKVSANDLIVVGVAAYNSVTISSISDTLGDSFSQVVSQGGLTFIYSAVAKSSGSDTVSVSYSTTGYFYVFIAEVSGVISTTSYTSTGYGSGTSLSVNSYTPPPDSFIFVTAEGYYGGWVAGNGYTDPFSVTGWAASAEYIASWGGGSTNSPFSIAQSSTWSEVSAAFPLAVPTASSSSSSWNKPGLSPFESYFTHESEYVSPGNGLLGIEQTDYSLPGRVLNLAITRVYSQPYAFTSSAPYMYDNYTLSNLGLGWQLNFPWMGATYLHLSDGQVYQYNWAGDTFLNNRGTPFKLLNHSGASYDFYLSSGVDYHFNSGKQLVSITDPTGNNVITFNYGSNNYVSSINDTAGRIVSFSYNSNNQLTMISTGEGNFIYGYSGSDLVSVTDPAGRVTTYDYNTGINEWLVSSINYPTGAYTDYSYGNSTVGPGIITYYVTSQNVYVSSNTLSKTTSYSYNIQNGVVTLCNSTVSDGFSVQSNTLYNFTNPSKTTRTVENSSGQAILSYENIYDPLGRINETKILSPTNSVLAYTTNEYDNWSNVIYTRNYDGQQAWFSYANTNTTNVFENAPSGFSGFYTNNTIDGNIHDLVVGKAQYQDTVGASNVVETYYDYNSAGELVHEKHAHDSGWLVSSYSYDQYGNMLTSTDPLGRTTYLQYSSTYNSAYLTQKSIMVGTQNVSTSYTYNATSGWMTSQTDPNGHTTYYSYDNLGRLTTTTYPAVAGVVAYKTYVYNDTGNYITIIDENGNSMRQYFDGLGNLVSIVQYNGSAVYSEQNYTYNYLNEIATHTTAIGNTYSYSYDAMGFQTNATNPDGTYQSSSYNYTSQVKTSIDENGHETQYGYDWMNNLIWVRQYYNSTNYYMSNYTYDLSGNLISSTDAKSQTTAYQYDDLNRLTVTKYPDGTNQTLTYDSVGNIASKTDPMGNTINYTYDSLNRLVNASYPDGTSLSYTYDNAGNILSISYPGAYDYYTYDARNRVTNNTQVIQGNVFPVLYSYDKVGNIISIAYPGGENLTYTYDPMERVASVGTLANFTYTLDGKVSSISYSNGLKTTYTYDSRDRPTRILSMTGGTKLLDLNYTYDGTGNVLSIDSESYTYNALNQIASASGGWGTIQYSYDPAGNMIQKVQGSTTTNYTYASYNRLTSAGNVNYTYNANGDMIGVVNGSNTMTGTYDYENRLTSVVQNGATVENNSFDGLGNLVYQVQGNSKTFVVFQGLNVLYSKTKQRLSTSTTDDVYANGMHIAKLVGSSLYFYVSDALGSTRLVTSSSGLVFSSDYLPYGPVFGQNGSEVFMYTGKPYDSLTGFYYYNARIYDPAIGRFITEDTYTGSSSDPLSLNRYIYARDNPEKYVDPNGHMYEMVTGGGGSASQLSTQPAPSTSSSSSSTSSSLSSEQSCGYFGCGPEVYASGPPISTGTSTDTATTETTTTTVTTTEGNGESTTTTTTTFTTAETTTTSTNTETAITMTSTYTTATSESSYSGTVSMPPSNEVNAWTEVGALLGATILGAVFAPEV
ncbi:MAG: RHS repeat-associated core domain-containing protein, partial [Nitrososphaerota archaeon]|nr:RHS repeat-associated core domain-containing protein [Nitrososphaerota archaeon]